MSRTEHFWRIRELFDTQCQLTFLLIIQIHVLILLRKLRISCKSQRRGYVAYIFFVNRGLLLATFLVQFLCLGVETIIDRSLERLSLRSVIDCRRERVVLMTEFLVLLLRTRRSYEEVLFIFFLNDLSRLVTDLGRERKSSLSIRLMISRLC